MGVYSLGFSKNSKVFLVGKTTLSINSCVHYLLGLTATLNSMEWIKGKLEGSGQGCRKMHGSC